MSGDKCQDPGCQGEPDCNDHGTCNKATGTCECNDGWTNDGCEMPQCDCNGHPATCEMREDEGDTKPQCYDCPYPYIGKKCEKRYDLRLNPFVNNGLFQRMGESPLLLCI